MQFSRRFGTPILTIAILIGFSVLTIVFVGEGFKFFVIRRDGMKLRSRDGTTITFNMSWNPPTVVPSTEAKAMIPVEGGLLGAVQAVASALLGDGSNIANNVQAQASALAATILPIVSSVLNGEQTQVPAALESVTSAINQATGVVGGIVSAANSIVASVVGGAPNTSNAGMPSSSMPTSKDASRQSSTSEPQEFLPQTVLCTTCNNSSPVSALPFNITAAPVLSSTSRAVPPSTSKSTCTSYSSTVTETCTVTETWHSTHYVETATYFSFIAAFTVNFTETVSICPSSIAYLPPVTTLPTPPLIVCTNGLLAKRAEDCPQVQPNPPQAYTFIASSDIGDSQISTHPCPNAGYSCSECPDGWFCPPSQTAPQSAPCGFGWACGDCSRGWFCIPNPTNSESGPVNSAASALLNISISLTQAIPPTMGSFTAQPPSLESTLPNAAVTAGFMTITCIDDSVVLKPSDCLNGIAGATSSLRVFGTSPVLTQATSLPGSVVGGATPILNPALSDVNSALAHVSGLTGGLLSTIIANVALALDAGNTLAGNLQPAEASFANAAGNLPSNVNTLAGNIPPATGAVNPLAGNVIAAGLSIVGHAAGNVASAVNESGGNIIPTATAAVGNVAGQVGNGGGGIIPAVTAALGNTIGGLPGLVKEVKVGDRTISHITTIVNGQPTILPIVTTTLNGIPTAVPVINMIVNGAPADLPVLNGGPGELAKLFGRSRFKTEAE